MLEWRGLKVLVGRAKVAERVENMSDAAVHKATGRDWAGWRAHLDSAGAQDWSHKQIVAHLNETETLSGWWQQTVTVGYEKMHGRRIIGQTADAGFQVGVQRTLPLALDAAWCLVMSPDAVRGWLGDVGDTRLEPGSRYRTSDGIEGEIRVVKPNDRVRLTWQPTGSAPSTLQIAVTPAGAGKTAIRFHHERLASADEREVMRQCWQTVLGTWQAGLASNGKAG